MRVTHATRVSSRRPAFVRKLPQCQRKEAQVMTKKELAAKLAKEGGLTVSKANEVLNLLFDANEGQGLIAQELEAGRKVTIPGFGTFEARHRAARQGTNPTTQKKMTIPARRYAHFKPGKTLRERMTEG